jgi:hypothetical protein
MISSSSDPDEASMRALLVVVFFITQNAISSASKDKKL